MDLEFSFFESGWWGHSLGGSVVGGMARCGALFRGRGAKVVTRGTAQGPLWTKLNLV